MVLLVIACVLVAAAAAHIIAFLCGYYRGLPRVRRYYLRLQW